MADALVHALPKLGVLFSFLSRRGDSPRMNHAGQPRPSLGKPFTLEALLGSRGELGQVIHCFLLLTAACAAQVVLPTCPGRPRSQALARIERMSAPAALVDCPTPRSYALPGVGLRSRGHHPTNEGSIRYVILQSGSRRQPHVTRGYKVVSSACGPAQRRWEELAHGPDVARS